MEKTFKVVVSLDANTPAGLRKSATLYLPGKSGVSEYVVPKGKMLIIKDIFIKESGDVGADGNAIIVQDGETDLYETPNISTLLVSNPSRPSTPAIVIDEYHRLGVDFINENAVGTSAVSNTFYIKVSEVEKTSKAGFGIDLGKLKGIFG